MKASPIRSRNSLRPLRKSNLWEVDRLVCLFAALLVFLTLVSVGILQTNLEAQGREQARHPELMDISRMESTGRQTLFEARRGFVDGKVWQRFFVAHPGKDLPPGLDSWPKAGHTVVSPALDSLLKGQRYREVPTGDLGDIDLGVISDDGLSYPGELVSWSVVEDLDSSFVVDHFGSRLEYQFTSSFTVVQLLGLIVALTVSAFVVFRQTAMQRYERCKESWGILENLGVGRCDLSRLVSLSHMKDVAIGSLAGTVLFAVTEPVLYYQEVFDLVWWPLGWTIVLWALPGTSTVMLTAYLSCLTAIARDHKQAWHPGKFTVACIVYVLVLLGIETGLLVSLLIFRPRFGPEVEPLLLGLFFLGVIGIGALAYATPAIPAWIKPMRNATTLPLRSLAFSRASLVVKSAPVAVSVPVLIGALLSLMVGANGFYMAKTVQDENSVKVEVSAKNPMLSQQYLTELPFSKTVTVGFDDGTTIVLFDCDYTDKLIPADVASSVCAATKNGQFQNFKTVTLNANGQSVSTRAIPDSVDNQQFYSYMTAISNPRLLRGSTITFVVDQENGELSALLDYLERILPTQRFDFGLNWSRGQGIYHQQRIIITLIQWALLQALLIALVSTIWRVNLQFRAYSRVLVDIGLDSRRLLKVEILTAVVLALTATLPAVVSTALTLIVIGIAADGPQVLSQTTFYWPAVLSLAVTLAGSVATVVRPGILLSSKGDRR